MAKHKGAGAQQVTSELSEPELLARLEREKKFIMYAGISFFMVLFASLWFVSFSGTVSGHMPVGHDGASLEQMLGKLSAELERARSDIDKARPEAASSTAVKQVDASMDSLNIGIADADLEKLKFEIEQGLSTSSKAALPSNK
jgi:hypothetical protein